MRKPQPSTLVILAGLAVAALVAVAACGRERPRGAIEPEREGPDLRPMPPVRGPDGSARPLPPIEKPPEPPEPLTPPRKPDPRPTPPVSAPERGTASYKVGEPGKGTIRGTCRISEVIPRPIVKATKDTHKGCKDHGTERLVVGEDRALGNCLVYLLDVKEGKDWPEALRGDALALVDQKACVYVPHVQWMPAGAQVVVTNSDQADHNIHGYRRSGENTQFNFMSPPGSKKDDVSEAVLERPDKYILKCDIHPWMNAYLHVVSTPYVALTSAVADGGRAPGEYVIDGVPPGTYRLVCWHESLVETPRIGPDGTIATYDYGEDFEETRTVTVGEGDTKQDFTVPAKK